MRDYRTLHKGFHGKPGRDYLVLQQAEPMPVETRLKNYLARPSVGQVNPFYLFSLDTEFLVTGPQLRRLMEKQDHALALAEG